MTIQVSDSGSGLFRFIYDCDNPIQQSTASLNSSRKTVPPPIQIRVKVFYKNDFWKACRSISRIKLEEFVLTGTLL